MSITSYSSSKFGPTAVVGAQQEAADIGEAFDGAKGTWRQSRDTNCIAFQSNV